METRQSFFPTAAMDADMEEANGPFWDDLIARIEEDAPGAALDGLLDVGCHRGGFLERVAARWALRTVYGIEPVAELRAAAAARLSGVAQAVILDVDGWERIPDDAVPLVTAQEVLYLVGDLDGMMRRIARVLRPGGAAYLTLGSHTENPLWPHWRPILVSMGLVVFDHSPLDILRAGEAAGLNPAVRPLRTDGWVTYRPSAARFPVPSVAALIDHHFRHKLLFCFEKP
ncbi:class I SAM-dependent methyltransferase [Azospirillum ramasamyi]|uniref:Methyltransferase type 11 domain-containing protein n=1 Tax=Azospirillum ramasamyi TaxID=682998 RepID=A0A2U9SEM7_9PROT|nr:class I SAM-dependent methyltransferase [Azospirillum ramasamyi]AWU98065.1 hypothetical protein DM194_27640 [Azospirillum ramasamyi]